MEKIKKSVWQQIDENEKEKIYAYGEDYKNFLDKAKTEREATSFIIEKAKEKGFIELKEALKNKIKKGDKIYVNNKNKSLALFVIGDDLEEGMNIVGSHIDSPRLDVKQNPLYEDSELAFLKTHYYGGIRKYQWPTIPLAIHGIIINKNNEKFEIAIGEDENDPIFYITDLLPHLSADQNKKPLSEAITAESLNVIVGHSSYGSKEKENPIKKLVLQYLNEKYNMVEEDFAIAELEVVPASKARDVGFDRAMVAGHGQDDRVCSFANLYALLQVENPKITAVGLFVDKEEIGSVGNTSMNSAFFENALAEILANQKNYSDLLLRRSIANSKVLSADVIVALDPDFKEVSDDKNAALSGYGVAIAKYTGARGKSGSNDANSEFLREVVNKFNDNNVIWQTSELGKTDQGGGGTIAYILAGKGAEVVDCGTAMLSMHAPYEILSKADAYMTMKAYLAFLK